MTMKKPVPDTDSSPAPRDPEQLDLVIATTKPQGWWALWALTAAVAITLVWAFIGTIPQQSSARAVVPEFPYQEIVAAPVAGTVHFDSALTGTSLKAGGVIATITPLDGGPKITIVAPVAGQIDQLSAYSGEVVVQGQSLVSLDKPPPAQGPIELVTYIPASEALNFTEGKKVKITVTDFTTSTTSTFDADIADVAGTPSSLDSMTVFSGSASLAEKWDTAAGGTPYRIMLTIPKWSSGAKTALPSPGEIVEITNVYGSIHPIDLLFGKK